jgi:hypothetical protein
MKTDKSMNKHTATPWRPIKDAQGICGLMHPTKEGVAVCWFSSTFNPINGYVGEDTCEHGRPEREANAAYIVKAINAHEALVEALRELLNLLNENEPLWYLRKHENIALRALKLAGEETKTI